MTACPTYVIAKSSGGSVYDPAFLRLWIFCEFFVLVCFSFLLFSINSFIALTVCLLTFVSMLSGPGV